MKRATKESAPQAPGAFRADGSFDQAGGWAQQGPIHALVASLVRQRRAGSLAIPEAIAQIRAAKGEAAFPWLGQWGGEWPAHTKGLEPPKLWSQTWTSTSAEEAVKRCGISSNDGHWCGQLRVDGSEKGCQTTGHGALPTKEEVASLVAAVVKALSMPDLGGATNPGALTQIEALKRHVAKSDEEHFEGTNDDRTP